MKKLDKFLLEYIQPLMPEGGEPIGYSVIDSENLRIWYFDSQKIKRCFMVAAP